ncbi:MAG: hypothetical protein ACRCX2_22255 [Paraclostridium sp.]
MDSSDLFSSINQSMGNYVAAQGYYDNISQLSGALASYAAYDFQKELDATYEDKNRAGEFLKRYTPSDVSYLYHSKRVISPDDFAKYSTLQSEQAKIIESDRQRKIIYDLFSTFDPQDNDFANKTDKFYETVANIAQQGVALDDIFRIAEEFSGENMEGAASISRGMNKFAMKTLGNAQSIINANNGSIKYNKSQQRLLNSTINEIDSILNSRAGNLNYLAKKAAAVSSVGISELDSSGGIVVREYLEAKSARSLSVGTISELRNAKHLLLAIKRAYLVP